MYLLTIWDHNSFCYGLFTISDQNKPPLFETLLWPLGGMLFSLVEVLLLLFRPRIFYSWGLLLFCSFLGDTELLLMSPPERTRSSSKADPLLFNYLLLPSRYLLTPWPEGTRPPILVNPLAPPIFLRAPCPIFEPLTLLFALFYCWLPWLIT